MNQTVDSREDYQTEALLKDLLRMQGSRCKECSAPLCGHETLMCLVAGYKESLRCLSCLSRRMGRGTEEVRDHLLGYILNRPCRHAGWMWANREEGTDSTALPQCLWPPAGMARKTGQPWQASVVVSDSPDPSPIPDAVWDAGDMGCGELVMGLRMRLQSMKPGQILKLTASDAGVPEDLPAWCRLTGHKLVYASHPEYMIQRREN